MKTFEITSLLEIFKQLSVIPYATTVLVVGGLLQVLFVMTVLYLSFQGPEHYSSVRLLKAFIYSLVFVVGAPILSLAVSALLVFGFPHIAKYLDVLTLFLEPFQALNQEVASSSRPLAYSLAILAALGFLVWLIRHANRYAKFSWRHAGQVLLALVVAIIFFQLSVYAVYNLFSGKS